MLVSFQSFRYHYLLYYFSVRISLAEMSTRGREVLRGKLSYRARKGNGASKKVSDAVLRSEGRKKLTFPRKNFFG